MTDQYRHYVVSLPYHSVLTDHHSIFHYYLCILCLRLMMAAVPGKCGRLHVWIRRILRTILAEWRNSTCDVDVLSDSGIGTWQCPKMTMLSLKTRCLKLLVKELIYRKWWSLNHMLILKLTWARFTSEARFTMTLKFRGIVDVFTFDRAIVTAWLFSGACVARHVTCPTGLTALILTNVKVVTVRLQTITIWDRVNAVFCSTT